MKPRPFDYACPDTIEEALALLAEHGDEARVLAGGQSLMAMLNLRLADPAVLIDITRIAELDAIRDAGGAVEVGAAVTQNKLLAWPDLAKKLPLLAAALPLGREWRRLFAFVTLAVLLNLALHDPELPGRWPFTLGGATGVPRLSHGRVFFAGELLAVRAANAFSVGVFLAFSWSVLRLGREQGAGLR